MFKSTYFEYHKALFSVLVAGLDNVKGIDGAGDIMPSCAPNDMSNKR